MANIDAVRSAHATLDTADQADTVTFSNMPAAVRVTNRSAGTEEDPAADLWANTRGEAEVEGDGSVYVPAGESRILDCPKDETVVVSLIGGSGEQPDFSVERLTAREPVTFYH